MSPKIHPAFWSDPDVERLDSSKKLCLLWIITNPKINCCGFFNSSVRRFSFETGLEEKALRETIEALPRALKGYEDGTIWSVNFISHQFGRGEMLEKNNIFRSITRTCAEIKMEALRNAILNEYCEISKALLSPTKGLVSPKEKEKEKEKEISVLGKKGVSGKEGESPELFASGEIPKITAEEIYEHYPKKVGREKAIKSIKSAIDHGAEPKKLLECSKKIAEFWSGQDLQFLPHPATFFNQGRFNDDPCTWKPNPSNPSESHDASVKRVFSAAEVIDLKQAIEEEEESVAELRREAFRPGLVQDEAWKRERAAKMEAYESRKANLERLKNRLSEHRQARFA